ncbi:MAG: c-type cytochrome, methanol metabolism-related [Rhizobiales bacterium]|nr:c-type cytochrome, methanol metabolism-related [Hyphomicrobiales bacterium]
MNKLWLLLSMSLICGAAIAEPPGDPKAVTNEDGKYLDANGDPTFNITDDGTVDWYTFSGYRRYHSDCHVCHGPAGQGSTYAPPLIDSLKSMNYVEYLEVVTNGRQKVGASGNSVMPAFGTNKNVMCYVDDIYVYLRARTAGVGGTGRPPKKEAKPAAFTEAETACMGG